MATVYLLDSVKVATPTTGTGSVAVGAADPGFLTPAEAGAEDQGEYIWRLDDGENFEIFVGTYSSSGPSVSRDTVIISKIGGTVGTSKINLSGLARLSSVPLVQWFRDMFQANLHLIGLAAGTDMRAGTADDKALTPKAAYDAMAEVTLSDASTIAIDLAAGTDFVVNLGGNRTLGNPSNAGDVIGKKGRIRIVHSDRTLAFGSNWEFAGGEAPDLSTGSNKTDILYYDVIAADRILGVLVKDIS